MSLSIHQSFLPFTDAEESLRFYRDALGFEVRLDVGEGAMRWITLGAPGQPDTSVVLEPAVSDPGVTQSEAEMIAEMMAKGTYAGLNLASTTLDADFDKIVAAGGEVVQEPTDQVYGLRDCALRDPAGNLIRIQQLQK
ncbi:MAG TPA: VOC family protein [Dietzia timorensis]|uniref:VOC family protein n=1 Tax=Dietzia timorensis TaxID=499555 RepID=A0A921JZ63_9ACTN|nr:VOC family protein [Dietzia timorensis]HJE91864.1 VOC family protein [Dietzia timorensis]